jgi:hypothetical protein
MPYHYLTLSFCSWGFTIATFYVILDWWASPAVLAVVSPQAFASATLIVIMTCGMYAADSGVVEEAYRKYNDSMVDLMNIVLHGVPFLVTLVLIVHRRAVIGAALPQSPLFLTATALTAYAYSASYFMTFSPIAQYEIHGISNTLIRTVVTFAQPTLAVLCVLYLGASSAVVPQSGTRQKVP